MTDTSLLMYLSMIVILINVVTCESSTINDGYTMGNNQRTSIKTDPVKDIGGTYDS